MKKWILYICGMLGIFIGTQVFAGDLPYKDISPNDSYYEAIEMLYNNGVLYDDGTGLFRPKDTIKRSDFVALSVGVACKSCTTPTNEDILKYSISPFIDLSKTNPAYYCIAYAAEKNIVQGYILDTTGTTSCQDGKKYQSSPFCEGNKTTRIEAVGMLLRQANLWNDTLNKNTKKTRTINDVSDYWYGYAQKGVDADILKMTSDGGVRPDESITRGEFIQMAAKIYTFNQCADRRKDFSESSDIVIIDPQTNNPIDRSVFSLEESFVLRPITERGVDEYEYEWIAINTVDGKRLTSTESSMLSKSLSLGNWNIELKVVDKKSGAVVSISSTTLSIHNNEKSADPEGAIGNGNTKKTGTTINNTLYPSITLTSSKQISQIGETIRFSSFAYGLGPLTYIWDYGDGTKITGTLLSGNEVDVLNKDYAYKSAGIYPVTVTLIDKNGQTVKSSLMIRVNGGKDSDGDGVLDTEDVCPQILGTQSTSGCPRVLTNIYSQGRDRGLIEGDNDTGNQNSITSGFGNGKIPGFIKVIDGSGNTLDGSHFSKNESFLLAVEGDRGNRSIPTWTIRDTTTGETRVVTVENVTSDFLGEGNFEIIARVEDTGNPGRVSEYTTQITIHGESGVSPSVRPEGNGNSPGGIPGRNGETNGDILPSVRLNGDTSGSINDPINLGSIAYGSGPLKYSWDFGDGNTQNSGTGTRYTYSRPGSYTVTLTITDKDNRKASSTMNVIISDKDSDNDGVSDSIDQCPYIIGTAGGQGCPLVSSILGYLEGNSCILNRAQKQGVIIATPICDQCPCDNTIRFGAMLRPCDILFPTILSLDLGSIYARGGFYQIP